MIPFNSNGAFEPVVGGSELRRQAVKGAAATVSFAVLALAAQIVSTVVLSRLLTPVDFGVVAMVTTFSLLLASVGLNGFTEAIIQFDEVDHSTASNLFWLSVGVGLVLAIGFASGSFLLARFYNNPLVTRVATALSIGIVVLAASAIHLALLKRGMNFVSTSTNEVVSRAVNTVVSIVLAFYAWGYWALVAGILAQQLSMTVGAWCLCRWIPGPPRRTGKTMPMVRFAASVYLRWGIVYFTHNLDNLLIGKQCNASALGFYKKAYDLFALTASQTTAPLANVALATLSRLNHDPARFRRALGQILQILAFICMAASAILTLVAKDVVRLVLGPQWTESIRIFGLFGPGIGAMILTGCMTWIHLAIGRPGRLLLWSVVQLAVTASLLVAALPWGPSGIALAWSISYWILLIPGFWFAGRPVGFGVANLTGAIWRFGIAALFAGLATTAILRDTTLSAMPSNWSDALISLIGTSIIFVSLYLAAIVVLYRGIEPLSQFGVLLRELSPKRPASEPLGKSAP